jgi:hypothetical protein
MFARRQRVITTETHSLTIIRLRQQQPWMQCVICGAPIPHLTVAEAAAALSLSETAVFRLAEAGDLHSIETARGKLMLCSGSLAAMGMEMERPKGE